MLDQNKPYLYVHVFYLPQAFTIVEEKNGFGKLKSGAGWLDLNYLKKV